MADLDKRQRLLVEAFTQGEYSRAAKLAGGLSDKGVQVDYFEVLLFIISLQRSEDWDAVDRITPLLLSSIEQDSLLCDLVRLTLGLATADDARRNLDRSSVDNGFRTYAETAIRYYAAQRLITDGDEGRALSELSEIAQTGAAGPETELARHIIALRFGIMFGGQSD